MAYFRWRMPDGQMPDAKCQMPNAKCQMPNGKRQMADAKMAGWQYRLALARSRTQYNQDSMKGDTAAVVQ